MQHTRALFMTTRSSHSRLLPCYACVLLVLLRGIPPLPLSGVDVASELTGPDWDDGAGWHAGTRTDTDTGTDIDVPASTDVGSAGVRGTVVKGAGATTAVAVAAV